MDEATQTPPIFKPTLTKEERSQIAKDAAKRRWAKAKKEAGKIAKGKAQKGKAQKGKKPTGPREFMSALKTAEKRLSKAIQERAGHAASYAVLSAEIPSLQRIIVALRNPGGNIPAPGEVPAFSLEQIVGDQPLPYQNPPRTVAVVPVPQPLHPANQPGRAHGGAVGVALEDESEDQFLKESAVAGGEWR